MMSFKNKNILSSKNFYLKKSKGSQIFDLANYIFIILVCISVIFPLWDTIVISFSRVEDVSSLRLNLWPNKIIFDSYKYCFRDSEFIHALFISISRTIAGTIYHVFIVSLTAYCLTRMQMPFRKTITVYFVATMFFSGGMIPEYLNIRNLDLTNNFLVYVIPSSFSIFTVIIVRNFFLSIDQALEEAANIDGASPLKILFIIILPLSKPVLATIALWQMVGQWNSWFDNLIYCSDTGLLTLQLLLRRIIVEPQLTELRTAYEHSSGNLNPVTIKSAVTVLVTFPIICVYPFLQKYFVKGIMLGSVKG